MSDFFWNITSQLLTPLLLALLSFVFNTFLLFCFVELYVNYPDVHVQSSAAVFNFLPRFTARHELSTRRICYS